MDQEPVPDGAAVAASRSPAGPDPRPHGSAERHQPRPRPEPAPRLQVLPSPRPAASPLTPQATGPVIGGAAIATAAVVVLDLTLTGRLSMFFDLCFILVGLSAAVLVPRTGLFAAGVLPPLLLGGVAGVLAVTAPTALTASHLAVVSTWLTGLAHHGAALVITHGVVLAIVGTRSPGRPGGRARPRAQAAARSATG